MVRTLTINDALPTGSKVKAKIAEGGAATAAAAAQEEREKRDRNKKDKQESLWDEYDNTVRERQGQSRSRPMPRHRGWAATRI